MRPSGSVIMVFDGEVGPDAALLEPELRRRGVDVTALAAGGGVGGVAALRRALREAEVVHAQGLRAALAVALARPGRTPFVVSLTEVPPVPKVGSLVARAVHRVVFPAAAAVLVPTPELAEAASRLGAREVRLLPPPLPDPPTVRRTPEQVREELALPPDGPIVLAAARLHPDTRLDVLVAAAARWRTRNPRPQVVLVGVGPAYRTLVAQATVARAPVTFAGARTDSAPALADRTVSVAGPALAGRGTVAEQPNDSTVAEQPNDSTVAEQPNDSTVAEQPNDSTVAEQPNDSTVAEQPAGGPGDQADAGAEQPASLSDVLAAATVAVVTDPSAQPGFALAAVRSGVALVATAGGTVAGLFPEGVVTVPPGDVDALDEAVAALLDDPPARADLVAGARQRLVDWPDAAAVAAELAGVYEGALRATPAEVSDTPT